MMKPASPHTMKLSLLLLLGLFMNLTASLSTKVAATRPQISSCRGGGCGGGSSYNSGYSSGGFGSGCRSGGCGLSNSYVSSSNPCGSGGCYSGCGSGGCSGSSGYSSGGCTSGRCSGSSGYNSGGFGSGGCTSGRCSGSTGYSSGGYSSGGFGGSSGGFSSSSGGCGFGGCGSLAGYSSGSSGCGGGGCGVNYRNCQCDWLFNSHGQGNCNVGGSGYTKDRWCYIDPDVNGQWIEPTWACPDAVASTEYRGKYWSRLACDTPKPSQSVHKK